MKILSKISRGKPTHYYEIQIDTKKNGGYRAAVDLLARIRSLATKGDQPQLFSQLLATVMTEHGRKRNLMALIDKKRWS